MTRGPDIERDDQLGAAVIHPQVILPTSIGDRLNLHVVSSPVLVCKIRHNPKSTEIPKRLPLVSRPAPP